MKTDSNNARRTTRRGFLKTTAALATTLAMPNASGFITRRGDVSDKPNIVFLFSDQQRADSVGCYGQPLNTTPNIDRLAADGVRFRNSFTCQPLCGPARSSLMTGQYPEESGCFRNGKMLPTSAETTPKVLAQQGYETAYVGKWHLASTDRQPVPFIRRGGFTDHWTAADVLEHTSHGYNGPEYGEPYGYMWDKDMAKVEFEGYRVDAHTDFVLDYLRARNSDGPFFLFVSYLEPHHQNDHGRFEGPIGSQQRFESFIPPGDLVGNGGNWQSNYPDYLGAINSIDYNIGRIRDELEKQGIADNTIFVYTSDHGCHFKTRNGEYKRSCHDSSIYVPMIVCGPGFTGGEVIDDIVSLVDLPPTLLTACRAPVPSTMRGRAMQPLLDGTAADWPEEAFVQISESQVGRAIRTAKWKYSVKAPGLNGRTNSSSDYYREDFLYDLENDPHEQNNLVAASGYADVRATLRETLIRRMVEAGEEAPTIDPQ